MMIAQGELDLISNAAPAGAMHTHGTASQGVVPFAIDKYVRDSFCVYFDWASIKRTVTAFISAAKIRFRWRSFAPSCGGGGGACS
jgi:hypothetical protein